MSEGPTFSVKGSSGPISSVERLKQLVKWIEEGKMSSWVMIYPLHGIYVKRIVLDQLETETKHDVSFVASDGLTAEELRWIAAKLIKKAEETEEVNRLYREGKLGKPEESL